MNILLVNNDTYYLNELSQLLKSYEVTMIKPEELQTISLSPFQVMILSGARYYSVNRDQDIFREYHTLIRTCPIPIIGICFGFQLIAFALGTDVVRMDEKRKGIIEIQTSVFGDNRALRVFESHRWCVKKSPENCTVLATSEDGIEVFKHNTKPLYAMQFHPEVTTPHNDGVLLFNTIMDSLV